MNTPKKKKNRIYTMLSGITFLVFLGCAFKDKQRYKGLAQNSGNQY